MGMGGGKSGQATPTGLSSSSHFPAKSEPQDSHKDITGPLGDDYYESNEEDEDSDTGPECVEGLGDADPIGAREVLQLKAPFLCAMGKKANSPFCNLRGVGFAVFVRSYFDILFCFC